MKKTCTLFWIAAAFSCDHVPMKIETYEEEKISPLLHETKDENIPPEATILDASQELPLEYKVNVCGIGGSLGEIILDRTSGFAKLIEEGDPFPILHQIQHKLGVDPFKECKIVFREHPLIFRGTRNYFGYYFVHESFVEELKRNGQAKIDIVMTAMECDKDFYDQFEYHLWFRSHKTQTFNDKYPWIPGPRVDRFFQECVLRPGRKKENTMIIIEQVFHRELSENPDGAELRVFEHNGKYAFKMFIRSNRAKDPLLLTMLVYEAISKARQNARDLLNGLRQGEELSLSIYRELRLDPDDYKTKTLLIETDVVKSTVKFDKKLPPSVEISVGDIVVTSIIQKNNRRSPSFQAMFMKCLQSCLLGFSLDDVPDTV